MNLERNTRNESKTLRKRKHQCVILLNTSHIMCIIEVNTFLHQEKCYYVLLSQGVSDDVDDDDGDEDRLVIMSIAKCFSFTTPLFSAS